MEYHHRAITIPYFQKITLWYINPSQRDTRGITVPFDPQGCSAVTGNGAPRLPVQSLPLCIPSCQLPTQSSSCDHSCTACLLQDVDNYTKIVETIFHSFPSTGLQDILDTCLYQICPECRQDCKAPQSEDYLSSLYCLLQKLTVNIYAEQYGQ